VEDLKARYEDEKQIIRDILKKQSVDVTVDTTYEAFAEVLSKDDRSAKLDAGNVKMVFERLLEKVQEIEKERIKEETRKRKKLESVFLRMLHDVEPAIDEKSVWDQVRPLVVNHEDYKIIETEPERLALFLTYQETLQESCSHHHSKSRKKKDKKKDSKTSTRRRSRSSSRSSQDESHSKSRRRSRSPVKDSRRRRSQSNSSSRSRSPSRTRDVAAKSKNSKSRSYSRSLSPKRSPVPRSGSSERNRRGREGREKPKSPVPEDKTEKVVRPETLAKGKESEASDIEELEHQRKILLQQLAAHKN
jgi:pre-mRNA-processing factor 40